MCVCKGRQMLFFWLEKSIACASSGSAQGPEHRQAGEESAEACDGRKGGSEGNAVIISQQLRDHQIDHQAKADKMPKGQRPLQSRFQQIGIYLLSSHVLTIQILQTNCSQEQSSSQLSALLLGHSKGAWGQSSIFASRNLKATQEGSEPPAQPLVWFLLDPCRNHAIWRQIYLLESKKKTKLSQATNLQLPPTQ